jgi:hypothetical protein
MIFEECAVDISRSTLEERAGSSGTVTKVNQAGGAWNVKSGATNGNYEQLQSQSEMYSVDKLASFSCRVSLGNNATCVYFFGFSGGIGDTGNDVIGFRSTNGGTWKAVCRSGGTETEVDTGIAWDGAFHLLSFTTDKMMVVFSIDDQVVAQIQTNIPTALMRAIAYVKTTTNADRDFGLDMLVAQSSR